MEYTKYVHQPALEILKDTRTAILYLAQYHKIFDIARPRILLRFLHRNVTLRMFLDIPTRCIIVSTG